MKNNDLQDLKPVYIHESNYSSNNTDSILDLAIVLLRRKKLFSVIIIVFITLGVSAALLLPKKYTYTTSIEIGSQIIKGSILPFEPPETLLAKLQYSFIPLTLNEHRFSNPGDVKKYKIKASAPKKSNIIVLEARATSADEKLVKSFLSKTSQQVTIDHSRIFNSVKRNLQLQLDTAESKLQNLGSGTENFVIKISLQNTIKDYSSQLANLRNTQEISPPMKSIDASGNSKLLIVSISIALGVLFAICTILFTEFILKIKKKIKN